ncbi:MAG: hypothetical protein AAFQ53_06885 [Bacteroidota bacterium]
MTRTVYVLQPESRPPPSMGDEPVIHRFERRVTTVTELQAALTLHVGQEDVPANRTPELGRLRRLLEQGTVLVQYGLVTAAHPDVAPRIVSPTGVPISRKTVARVLGVDRKVVQRAVNTGLLPTWPTGDLPLTSDGSDALDAFALRHAQWQRLRLLDLPRRRGNRHGTGAPYVTDDDVRAADRACLLAARTSGDELFVYTDARWLRWFADQMHKDYLPA